MEWRAGQLAIGQLDVEFFDRPVHHRQIVITNLVTKSTRTTMDDEGDLIEKEAQRLGSFLIKNFGHVANFQKVIAGAECAALAGPARQGPLADVVGLGRTKLSASLGVLDVALRR